MKKTLPILAILAGATALVLYKIKKDEDRAVSDLDDGLEIDDDYIYRQKFNANELGEQAKEKVEQFSDIIKTKVDQVKKSVANKSEEIIEDANDLSDKIVKNVEKFDQYYTHLLEAEVAQIKANAEKVMEDLQQQGDVHTLERPVQHHLTFQDDQSLQSFKKEIINKGFVITNGDNDFEIFVLHISPLQGTFFDNLLYIANIGKAFHGNYLGWNTQAMH